MDEVRPWSELPTELLALIIAYLDFADRSAVFAVCKRWQSVCLSIKHEDQLPWLMFLERSRGILELLDPWFNKKYTLQIPGLNSSKILSSNHGWLLMCHGLSSLFFLHPFSKAKIDLPRFKCPCKSFKAGFSSSPISEDSVVFVICSLTKASNVFISTWHHGCKKWTDHSYELGMMTFEVGCFCPIFHDGVFYCMDGSGRKQLGEFHIDKRTWTVFGDQLKGMDLPPNLRLIVECSTSGGGLVLSTHDQERLQLVSSEVKRWRDLIVFKDALVSNLVVGMRPVAMQSRIQSFGSHLYEDFCVGSCAICETMCRHDVFVYELKHGNSLFSSFDGIWIEPRWSRPQLDWYS
ncbi:hypothetical protein ACLOJK_002085 [Asimina triloba]